MNYSNHNLRTNLQEWKNRLSRSTFQQFDNQLKYIINNIQNNKQLLGIISEACIKYNYSSELLEENIEKLQNGENLKFESEVNQAAFNYQLIKFIIINIRISSSIINYGIWGGRDFESTKSHLIEDYLSPIFYYLHDKLDNSNSVIYLLEKYKLRTEWFTRTELVSKYETATKSYEQIFEDDLRLFLFDQGIDYPFSTPLSKSGRADIVSSLDTEDPLIIEIKIFDKSKKYEKDRIKSGFTQIVKYANDYNKDTGFLVVYNMEPNELNFINNDENTKKFPISIIYNNKVFYIVIVNCNRSESASKTGILKTYDIDVNELIKGI